MTEPLRIRYRCLSGDPVILAGPFDNEFNNFFHPEIVSALADRQARFIVYQSTTLEVPAQARLVIDLLRQRMAENPRHRYFAMANTPLEVEILREAGIPCGLINANAMINEFFYRPLAGTEKAHDAIYNAGLVPQKRIHLARAVPKLALLFADYHNFNPEQAPYEAQLRELMTNADFVNQPRAEDAYRWLYSDEVVQWYNRSQVGLCLSAAEGAMRSSMEYLLCGLPVVSTPSIGGRDVFFHPGFARIVEPDADAIAAAVAALIAEKIAPEKIRSFVVPRLRLMRHRFQYLVQAFLDEAGAGRIFAPDWKEFLGPNWLRYEPVATLLADLEALRAEGR